MAEASVSDFLKKLAGDILAGISTDEYLEDAENAKKEMLQKIPAVSNPTSPESPKKSPNGVSSQEPKIEYKPPPKFKPSRKNHTFKNKWDKKETMTEYMREYRMNNSK
jgi:hypothetical protein